MKKSSKIFVAGHNGMVGSAICRTLYSNGYKNIIKKPKEELDLTIQADVFQFLNKEKPEAVINAAAKVGGILANKNFPYEFIMQNMLIQNNLIDCSYKIGVKQFVFLGSSCIYPKLAPQPLKEEYLLTSSLEPTNDYYAIAKISGLKACQAIKKQYGGNYISLMPTNLYGYYDNFNLQSSHVLPAMIRKFHEAKENDDETVHLWGSGKPMREFLFADDLGCAVLFCLENELSDDLYNIGTGKDIEIRELAKIIQKIIGHKGKIIWDCEKPDGTPRKVMDISKMSNHGWKYSTSLKDGIKKTYSWFLENINNKNIRL